MSTSIVIQPERVDLRLKGVLLNDDFFLQITQPVEQMKLFELKIIVKLGLQTFEQYLRLLSNNPNFIDQRRETTIDILSKRYVIKRNALFKVSTDSYVLYIDLGSS